MAANKGAREAAWLEKVMIDIGERDLEDEDPYVPTLYCDNKGAVQLAKTNKFHKRAKHIEVGYFFIQNNMVLRKRLNIMGIPGVDQIADILTKQTPVIVHWKHAKAMGLNEPQRR
jgi:hypothetical protein